jgi:alkylation response protein AidB-like acyl-CoA dehydrogenase
MDFDESPEEAAFRAEAGAWLDAHLDSPEAREVAARPGEEDAALVDRGRRWQKLLAEERWTGISWPTAYGGRGGTDAEAAIFAEESRNRSLWVGMFAVGIAMAGPTIITHGTDAQKERYLQPMLRGDEVWCQLFSEPGAGSDLAGISCRAERDGDEWVVNGQKVWTSGADYSDHGMLLARTDFDAPKHRGISYFLIDVEQPGVEVRPLRQMTGASHFSEVFFTDARVADADLLGGLNQGWGVAMTTLANERAFMGGGSPGPTVADLIAMAQRLGATADPRVRQGLAAAYSRAKITSYLSMRVRTAVDQGRTPGPEASVMKLFAAWNLKRNTELAMAVQGAAALLDGDDAIDLGRWQTQFLSAPSIRIAGGSDQIQRNVMGERTLGLPAEPRVDKGIPFRDIGR